MGIFMFCIAIEGLPSTNKLLAGCIESLDHSFTIQFRPTIPWDTVQPPLDASSRTNMKMGIEICMV